MKITDKIVTTVFILSCLIGAKTQAQKLPNVQENSVEAPAGVKINGDIAEWGTTLQAYNRATDISYTLANDAQNLYFVVQATDHGIIQKIVAGGITLAIKPADKKSNVKPVAITYPLVPSPYDGGVSYKLRTTETFTDQMLSDLNKQVFGHIKEIRIIGSAALPDSAVSVYNELGIKAAGNINAKKIYTTELVIPLKYLSTVIDEGGNFKYTVTENGLDRGNSNAIVLQGRSTAAPAESAPPASGNFLLSATYFSGSYKLVKK